MNTQHVTTISTELGILPRQIEAVATAIGIGEVEAAVRSVPPSVLGLPRRGG